MNKEILHKAIEHYGIDYQVLKAMEEIDELRYELYRPLKEVEYIIDEIADVTIMLEQLKLIYNCEKEVNERIEFKIDRLEKRIKRNLKIEDY
jgi:hypothetical protein